MTYRLRYNRRFVRLLDVLPGDVRAQARQLIKDLTNQPRPTRAKELDDHPGYWRMWLPREHRLVWRVIENERIVHLLYIGPKSPDLYEQLGLSRQIRDAE